MIKKIDVASLIFIFYGIMMCLSLWYYLERTAILDASFQLFYILKDDDFAIQVNRFGAALTQIFPLVSSKLGLSLKGIAMIYSVGFILLYTTTFYVLAIKYKNLPLGIVFFLFNFGITTHSFFWIQCELMPGICISMLLFAIIENQCQNKQPIIPLTTYIHIIPLLFLITFTYPLLPFVILFGLGFYVIYYKESLMKFLPIISIYLLLVFIKTTYLNNWYDNYTSERIYNISKLFPDYFNLVSHVHFAHYVLHHWYFYLIILILGCYIGCKNKFYRLVSFTFVFTMGFLFVLNVSWAEGADEFYLEPQYSILMIFASFLFAYVVIPLWSPLTLKAFLSIIVFFFVFRIIFVSQIYTDRVQYISTLISKAEEEKTPKAIVYVKDIDMQKLKMTWAIGSESWLISTIKNKKTTSIIIEDSENQFQKLLPSKDSIIVLNRSFDVQKLRPLYFKPASTPYIKIQR